MVSPIVTQAVMRVIKQAGFHFGECRIVMIDGQVRSVVTATDAQTGESFSVTAPDQYTAAVKLGEQAGLKIMDGVGGQPRYDGLMPSPEVLAAICNVIEDAGYVVELGELFDADGHPRAIAVAQDTSTGETFRIIANQPYDAIIELAEVLGFTLEE